MNFLYFLSLKKFDIFLDNNYLFYLTAIVLFTSFLVARSIDNNFLKEDSEKNNTIFSLSGIKDFFIDKLCQKIF